MKRPDKLLFVVGTGTEVGKTYVSAELLAQSPKTKAARKPVQSFDPDDDATDADILGEATGEDPEIVCPVHRRFYVPMAPPMAADYLGRPEIFLKELRDEVVNSWPDSVELGLVEGAGGVASPVAHDGDNADFIARLEPDVVILIADAGLGTINAVRLSMAHLSRVAVTATTVVHLNRYDRGNPLHSANRRWLERDGYDITSDVAGLLRYA